MALKEQLPEAKVGKYIADAIESLQELLESREEPAEFRKKVKDLLEDSDFKRGASVIEFSKDDSLDKELKARNEDQLSFANTEREALWDLKRYTIDSVKQVPKKTHEKGKEVDEIEIVRVVEAILKKEKTKWNAKRLKLSHLIDPISWLEEDRDEATGVIEHHKTLEELTELFPTKDIPIVEGRVILGNKNLAFDVTELVRQSAKASYKKLLKSEGKKRRTGKGRSSK